ncbi:pantoate--beta-alanine ligase [Streptococcus infantarius]|uniref:pantoate--beta-alanine ligase n=1 Tax=Streptococcus infantarius TaxID=102684 RepID=UPI00208F20AF|nr:pantoate--beta-alanine ligase [Streptococcus infantarius]MCO4494433.1 aspartate 1-decarboxylase [Streptococcus infantarius subsp. infantarius]MCO4502234.1 aspartate 1-decarboxylase [Streptococcus infantarius subsp. infantarius]MCY7242179.1 pantoate--beta-alanine ligase [Streptococcus infantarius]
MKIVHTVEDVRKAVQAWKAEGKTIGLVSTMGYIHEGHKSLIDKAVSENDHVVVSIFVNPIQFAPTEDLESYPRDLEQDAKLCEDAGASLIFNPEPSDMYSPTFSSFIDMSTLTKGLCGKTRPIHFRGVCTVVGKLFNIVEPNKAYFGQKDVQQLAVIKHMVEDLNFNLEIVGCPIVREADGMAKSSRNTYLSADERKAALVLSQSLALAEKMINDGKKDTSKLKEAMTTFIEKEPLAKIDYVEFVDWKTLEPGKGEICLNGTAAKLVNVGDHVIIMSYADFTPEEAKTHKPHVVFVDEHNQLARFTRYEKAGRLYDLEVEK